MVVDSGAIATAITRLFDSTELPLPPDFAKAILHFKFAEKDHERMNELSDKANEGTLTPDERKELEGYVVVGEMLTLMSLKARQSLHASGSAA